MKKYYLIEAEDIDAKDNEADNNMYITTEPWETNLSHEVRIDGWLGTTNNTSYHAHGVYDSLKEARKAAIELGYEFKVENNMMDGVVETLTDKNPDFDHVDARDFLCENTDEELGLNAETTDVELKTLAAKFKKECMSDQNVYLYNTLNYLRKRHDEIVESDEEAAPLTFSEKFMKDHPVSKADEQAKGKGRRL